MIAAVRFAAIGIGFLALTGCSSMPSPPRNALNLCSVFAEKIEWQKPTLRSEKRWNIPASVLMATMFHESSYRADARPPRRYFLGFIPGSRPSTAYGYAQALDGTWDEYVSRNSRWFANRDEFDDAIDFIGWYHSLSTREIGIRADDAINLYLAYHEGRGGFARNSYLDKPWLVRYAERVGATELSYRSQLVACPLGK
ncbi:MAG: hypothetical protein V4730_07315 [Pseudomonadota bacterium]